MSRTITAALLILVAIAMNNLDIAAQVYQPIIYNAPHLGSTEVSTDNGVSWHPVGPEQLHIPSSAYHVTDVYVTNSTDTLHSRDLGVSWQSLGQSASSELYTEQGDQKKTVRSSTLKAMISPNPTSGVTTVRFNRSATFSVDLIAPSGRQIWNSPGMQTNSSNELLFDLSGYTPGIYLIVFRDLQHDTVVVLKVAVKP